MSGLRRHRRKAYAAEVLESRYALSAEFGAISVALDAFQVESPRIEVVETAGLHVPIAASALPAPQLKFKSPAAAMAPADVADLETPNLPVVKRLAFNPPATESPIIPDMRIAEAGQVRIRSTVEFNEDSLDLLSLFESSSFVDRNLRLQFRSYEQGEITDTQTANRFAVADGPTGFGTWTELRAPTGTGRPAGTGGSGVVLPGDLRPSSAPAGENSPGRGILPDDRPIEVTRSRDSAEASQSPLSSRMSFGWTMPRITEERVGVDSLARDFAAENGEGEKSTVDISHLLDREMRKSGGRAARYRLAETRDWIADDIAVAAGNEMPHQAPAATSGMLLARYRRPDRWVANTADAEPPASDQAAMGNQTATDIVFVGWTPSVSAIPLPIRTEVPQRTVRVESVVTDNPDTDAGRQSSILFKETGAEWDRVGLAFVGTIIAGLGCSLALAHVLDSFPTEPATRAQQVLGGGLLIPPRRRS